MPTIKVDLNDREVRAIGEFADKEGVSFYKAIRVIFHRALDLPELNVNERGGSSQHDAD